MSQGLPVVNSTDGTHSAPAYPWPSNGVAVAGVGEDAGAGAAEMETHQQAVTLQPTPSPLPWLPGSAELQLVDSLSSLRQGWDAMSSQLNNNDTFNSSSGTAGGGGGAARDGTGTSKLGAYDDDDGDLEYEEDQDMSPEDRSDSLQPQQSTSTAKQASKDSIGNQHSTGQADTAGELKKKSTRGSRACQVCRKLKMRCVGAEDPPCKRCRNQGHECIFEESQRGRRSNRKADLMAKSLKKMEATMEAVLRNLSAPGVLPHSSALLQEPNPNLRQVGISEPGLSTTSAGGAGGSSSVVGTDGPRSGERPVITTPSDMSPHTSILPKLTDGGRFEIGGGAAVSRAPESTGRRVEWARVRDNEASTSNESPRLHSLPDNTLNPLGLLAEASLQNTRKRPVTVTDLYETANGLTDTDEREIKRSRLGMGNPSYFQPGPMNILPLRRIVIEQRMPPALLEEKIVTVEEVVELFQIFFEHCHRHAPFLDVEIHTPAHTGSRSPFLFTCICTVAARYYTKRSDDLYRKCLRIAKKCAFDVMTKGYKSTEICQGFLLLCNWNQPAERFEEERTYQFSGIAIRMATDLNLHRKTLAVLPEDINVEQRTLYQREIMNRERTWIYCFIADRSIGTQMGKPYSIPKEDYIIRSARTWHTLPGAQQSDVGLSAIVEAHRIVGRMIDMLYSDTRSVSGLNANLDYPLLIRSFLGQLDQWLADWRGGFGQDVSRGYVRGKAANAAAEQFSQNQARHMADFYHSYYRLFLLSFALQHALEQPDAKNVDLPSYCIMCFENASTMIAIARDILAPKGTLRYAMDSTFVYLSYAATFLLKLISPTFTHLIDEEIAMRLVRDVAETFERCAVDESHTPALYASFLRTLIDNKLHGSRTVPGSRAGTRPGSPIQGASSLPTNAGPSSANMETLLKHAAGDPSAGLSSNWSANLQSEHFLGLGAEYGDQAFDGLAPDPYGRSDAFWDNFIPGSSMDVLSNPLTWDMPLEGEGERSEVSHNPLDVDS